MKMMHSVEGHKDIYSARESMAVLPCLAPLSGLIGLGLSDPCHEHEHKQATSTFRQSGLDMNLARLAHCSFGEIECMAGNGGAVLSRSGSCIL